MAYPGLSTAGVLSYFIGEAQTFAAASMIRLARAPCLARGLYVLLALIHLFFIFL